ncbi:MAG TPA: hypothetical protein P5079_08100 [Elusimicrobiota bacterium]|nr:hypothetical protein [Elusimicrobiota bacterium]
MLWPVLLWILGLFLVAWVFYNAWENINMPAGTSSTGRRLRALSGDRVRSLGELLIANWLFKRKIPFAYDKAVSFSLREPPLRPDFLLDDRHCFIEFLGKEADRAARDQKEKLYSEKGWKVVWVTPEDLDRLNEVLSPLTSQPAGV